METGNMFEKFRVLGSVSIVTEGERLSTEGGVGN